MDGLDNVIPPARTPEGAATGKLGLFAEVRSLTGRLLLGQTALACLPAVFLLAYLLATPSLVPFLAELRRSGVASLSLAASLLAVGGLCGAYVVARARARDPQSAEVGWTARWPQAFLVAGFALAAAAAAWLLRPAGDAPLAPPPLCHAIGGAAIVLAFPLLVMERTAAALPAARLPEAPALRALLLVPALAWPAAGLLELASGLGAPAIAARLGTGLALLLLAIAAELALRALARLFLPPPEPERARAAVSSAIALALCRGAASRGGLAVPIQQHFGIDFARSWALSYARAAVLPLALALLLAAWGLSGVVLIGPDERAVYERFGAPVSVLHPGLHAMLPWPLGRARRLDYGPVHAVSLTDVAAASRPDRTEAEAPAPRSADRLWEQAHPAEVVLLIASEGGDKRQLFQVISADIRVLYRIGLSDADARRAAYSVADPAALVRAAAGRATAGFFAGQTLDAVLGENREAIGETLRAGVQRDLDGTGIEIVALVIEAIHPPAGAAQAYHGVQAAEIQATSSIAAEQGRALAARASAAQYAADLVNQARAGAAETAGEASATLARFNADRAAARVGGESFLLERYLAAVTALAKVPLLVLDDRLDASGAPILDLRPPGGPAVPSAAGHGME